MKNEWLDRAAMKKEIESLRAQVTQLKNQRDESLGNVSDCEQIAEKGYAEAYQIIVELRTRLESQKKEFEETLEKGYEEAYQMILQLKNQNNTLETTLYEEYDAKLKDMKEYIVDKVDEFLRMKSEELREANHDTAAFILQTWLKQTTPRQIVDEAIGDTQGELTRDEMKAQIRILEAKNMRLSAECEKLRGSETAAKNREKEIRKVVGLPDQPIMQDMVKGLLGTAMKKNKNVKVEDESYTDS